METYGRNMIHIRLLHHRTHRPFDAAILEFEIRMFIPEIFQIEPRPIHEFLQERQIPRVRDGFLSVGEGRLEREGE